MKQKKIKKTKRSPATVRNYNSGAREALREVIAGGKEGYKPGNYFKKFSKNVQAMIEGMTEEIQRFRRRVKNAEVARSIAREIAENLEIRDVTDNFTLPELMGMIRKKTRGFQREIIILRDSLAKEEAPASGYHITKEEADDIIAVLNTIRGSSTTTDAAMKDIGHYIELSRFEMKPIKTDELKKDNDERRAAIIDEIEKFFDDDDESKPPRHCFESMDSTVLIEDLANHIDGLRETAERYRESDETSSGILELFRVKLRRILRENGHPVDESKPYTTENMIDEIGGILKTAVEKINAALLRADTADGPAHRYKKELDAERNTTAAMKENSRQKNEVIEGAARELREAREQLDIMTKRGKEFATERNKARQQLDDIRRTTTVILTEAGSAPADFAQLTTPEIVQTLVISMRKIKEFIKKTGADHARETSLLMDAANHNATQANEILKELKTRTSERDIAGHLIDTLEKRIKNLLNQNDELENKQPEVSAYICTADAENVFFCPDDTRDGCDSFNNGKCAHGTRQEIK